MTAVRSTSPPVGRRGRLLGWLGVGLGAVVAAAGGVAFTVIDGLNALDSPTEEGRMVAGMALALGGLAGALLAAWGWACLGVGRRWFTLALGLVVAIVGLFAPWVVAAATS